MKKIFYDKSEKKLLYKNGFKVSSSTQPDKKMNRLIKNFDHLLIIKYKA